MTEQLILWYHGIMFFILMGLTFVWSTSQTYDLIIKIILGTMWCWNAAILATWLGWIKIQ